MPTLLKLREGKPWAKRGDDTWGQQPVHLGVCAPDFVCTLEAFKSVCFREEVGRPQGSQYHPLHLPYWSLCLLLLQELRSYLSNP